GVIVAHGDALAVAAGAHSGLLGDVGERAVPVVAIERVAERRLRIVEIAAAAVHQVDVHPTVVVVVDERAARARGLRQVHLGRPAVRVYPRDAARSRRDLLKGGRRGSLSRSGARRYSCEREPGAWRSAAAEGGATQCFQKPWPGK